MTSQPLESLTIRRFKSIVETQIDLSSDVTILVGPNGAGKSNIVAAFELIGRILDGQLQEHVLRSGGASAIMNAASSNSEDGMEFEVWGVTGEDQLQNGYRATILPTVNDEVGLLEGTYFWDHSKHSKPFDNYLGSGPESKLADQNRRGSEHYVRQVLSGCRVFHFDDVSAQAPPKTTVDVVDDLGLSPDAHNLAAVLLRLQTDHPESYERIVRAVRSVAPYFADFVLRESHEKVLLRWRERGLDKVFSADALSDGTLRFVCLATLLLQPEPPSTIILDEPELGLHPFAIHQLAALLRNTSKGRRIVAATQSVTLLSQFTLDQVAVIERGGSGTQVRRHSESEFADWLVDYSVGELWEKNLLGGRPRPDRPGTAAS